MVLVLLPVSLSSAGSLTCLVLALTEDADPCRSLTLLRIGVSSAICFLALQWPSPSLDKSSRTISLSLLRLRMRSREGLNKGLLGGDNDGRFPLSSFISKPLLFVEQVPRSLLLEKLLVLAKLSTLLLRVLWLRLLFNLSDPSGREVRGGLLGETWDNESSNKSMTLKLWLFWTPIGMSRWYFLESEGGGDNVDEGKESSPMVPITLLDLSLLPCTSKSDFVVGVYRLSLPPLTSRLWLFNMYTGSFRVSWGKPSVLSRVSSNFDTWGSRSEVSLSSELLVLLRLSVGPLESNFGEPLDPL